jgi:peptide methionine sulfoxide reductase MsrB
VGVVAFNPTADGRRHLLKVREMQKKQAMKLQEAWGQKRCEHPVFAKEYDHGERTGKYVCTQCGAILTFREKVEAVAAREK